MPHELKFRTWSKVKEQMTQRYTLYQFLTRTDELAANLAPEEDLVFMQFTGLHDKNGAEVFEGDIVRCSSGCPHEVYWYDGGTFSLNDGWGMPRWYLRGLEDGYSWTGREEIIGDVSRNSALAPT